MLYSQKILSTVFLFLLSINIYGQEKSCYTVTGSVYNRSWDGTKVYITKIPIYSGHLETIDSTKIKNGKFKFKGTVYELPHLYTIGIPTKSRSIYIALERGQMNVRFDENSETVSGTPLNDSLNKNIIQPLLKVIQKPTDPTHLGHITKEWRANKLRFVKTYAEFPVVEEFLCDIMMDPFEKPELPDIWARLPKESRQRLTLSMERFRQYYKEAENKIETQRKAMEEKIPVTVRIGSKFTDFKGLTPNGDTLKISRLMAGKKLILIDFWASWCGPCMKAIPEVAALYDKFRKKGLEIIGLSSDVQPQAWTKAIKEKQMTWPQLLEYKGNDKSPSEIYGIIFIPYTILVDAEGHIVARNLKGAELTAKIAEILD